MVDLADDRRLRRCIVPGVIEMLGNGGICPNKLGDRLVESHAQRLGFAQGIRVSRIATEEPQELLDLPGRRHWITKVVQRLTCRIEPRLPFLQPVLDLDVVVAAATLVDVELVRAVDRDRVLNVTEQLLEVDDIPVVLVVAIEAIGPTNGLEERMIAQLVVKVDVGAARRVAAGEKLRDHYQELRIRRLLDEPPLDFGLVGRRALPALEDEPRVCVVLVALITVRGLARDRVVVRLERRDDAHVRAEPSVLELAEVLAGVADRRRHEDGGATVVAQPGLQVEVLNDLGDDPALALGRAEQLLHCRPATA